jgi:hypothetical protein
MPKRDARNLVLKTTAAETQFLRTELLAGLNFSKIALEGEDESKIERNRANARKAYDALLRFIPDAAFFQKRPEKSTHNCRN